MSSPREDRARIQAIADEREGRALTASALDPSDVLLYAFRRNVVVAASAGTGKTHRLTALYVLLTLGLTSLGKASRRDTAAPVLPDRIVATTFSRAAAREIAERVERALRGLAAWSGEGEIPFGDVLRARAEETGELLDPAEIRARAEAAADKLPRARIDTLHGIASRIVRANALELGLPPSVRVLEEDEARALADLAVDESLASALGAGGDTGEAARDLVRASSGVAGARQNVVRLLDRLDEEGITPSMLARADHGAEASVRRLDLERVVWASAAGGSPKFREPAKTLAALLGAARGSMIPEAATAALTELFAVRMPPQAKRLAADADLAALRDERKARPAERATEIMAFLREAPALSAREDAITVLLEDARARMIAARRRAGALSFGDLLRAARDGLRDDPDLRLATAADIDVLLVDEFQDTSRVQRDLVYLLRERDDAARARPRGRAPEARGLAPAGLFLVGDRKQSIYGFRGADVAVFARVCAELAGEAAGRALSIPEDAWASEPVADFIALRESRRSGPRLLDFVNAFAVRDFAGDRAPGEAPRDFEVAYGGADALAAHADRDARADDVLLVEDDGSSPADAPPLVRDAEGPLREAFVAAALVHRLVRGGGDGESPMRFGDIAILARRRKTISLLEFALGRLDLPYVVAGRALYDAREIRDVAAILRLILDPRDRLALATVLRGPVVALSDAALAKLSVPSRGLAVELERAPDEESLRAMADLPPEERQRLTLFRERFADLRPIALRAAPGDAIRLLVGELDVDRMIAALPRAEARLGNVDRLVAIARKKGGTLAGFVRWLDRRIDEEADEPEAAVFSQTDDAVRLTTIHGSKGLDFPVVVLVDLNHEPRPMYAGIDAVFSGAPTLSVRHVSRPVVDALDGTPADALSIRTPALRRARNESFLRERAERRRLSYVALTRARETLAIVGSVGRARSGSTWGSLSTALLDPEVSSRITRREKAADLLGATAGAMAPAEPAREALPIPIDLAPRKRAEHVALATTAIALFQGCARRFRLRHLLGLDEPVASGQLDLFDAPIDEGLAAVPTIDDADPRALGRAAHRVLERWPREAWGSPTTIEDLIPRLAAEGLPAESFETKRIAQGLAHFLEGPYARELSASAAELRREHEFVLSIEDAAAPEGPRVLELRGAIDLLVVHDDARVDVVDYKLSAPRRDLSTYAFQLRAYARFARRRYPAASIRAGVLFLGHGGTPVWLGGGPLRSDESDAFERDLGALATRFAEARADDRWEGVPLLSCREQHCGFVKVCHPKGVRARGSR